MKKIGNIKGGKHEKRIYNNVFKFYRNVFFEIHKPF